MDISIIIVNWNTKYYLRNCLLSIENEINQTPNLSIETIVIDNNSNDGSKSLFSNEFSWVLTIFNNYNRGFAVANNQGIALAKGDFLLFLNPDTEIHPGTFNSLYNFLNNNQNIGAVGPKLINPDGTLQPSVTYFPNLFRELWRMFHLDFIIPFSKYPNQIYTMSTPVEVDVLKGACIITPRNALNCIGQFDEAFFVYSEEVDFCKRLKLNGWKNFYLPYVKVTHHGGKSTEQISEEMFIELYRSKVKFFKKYYGQGTVYLYKFLICFTSILRIISGKILSIFNQKYKIKTHYYTVLIVNLKSF
jgi:GT2 family glycosyltransferase